jgi:hypothetical protein
MNKQLIYIPGLFAVIAIVVIVILNSRNDSDDDRPSVPVPSTGDLSIVDAGVSKENTPAPLIVVGGADFEHIQALEDKVA